VTLLRVLQNGEFTRVGGNEVVKTDARVIAACNIDLAQAVEQGKFRKDLYYRLNVYPITLPPLRERVEDIPLLVAHFMEVYNKKSNRNIGGISEKALHSLKVYQWPGNVRELENAIERAVIVAKSKVLDFEDLPDPVRRAYTESRGKVLDIEVGTRLDEIERKVILETLGFTGGDKAKAARVLGIGRKTLYRKLKEYEQTSL
jgi:two-component system response regulator HydG